ncbi:hypothetical protein MMC11_007349 [Xylographa trunciseda]|nr:hypothetical protein [Xylographa trunciseda]
MTATPPLLLLTTLHLAHLPPDLAVHIALCRELRNAAFLRQQLLDGNAAFEYALLDASSILSPTHLHAAIFRAVTDDRAQRLKSRNVHAEIVFALSPNNNIAESFRKFGITPHTTDLVVVKLSTDSAAGSAGERAHAEAVRAHLEASVEGRWGRFGEASCAALADVGKIRKVYKLGEGGGGGKGRKGRREGVGDAGADGGGGDERSEMEVTILGLMALRGAS